MPISMNTQAIIHGLEDVIAKSKELDHINIANCTLEELRSFLLSNREINAEARNLLAEAKALFSQPDFLSGK